MNEWMNEWRVPLKHAAPMKHRRHKWANFLGDICCHMSECFFRPIFLLQGITKWMINQMAKRWQRSLCCYIWERQKAQLMLTNPRDAFRGQSRSPNIVPFHMLGIVSSCAIVRVQFYSRLRLLCCYVKKQHIFKTCCFSYIQPHKMLWPWNPGQRSLKVIESDTIDCVWFPIETIRNL